MKKLRVYLDTSIISAYFDAFKPIRQMITQKWFENRSNEFDLYASALVIVEIMATRQLELRNNMMAILEKYQVKIFDLTQEMDQLAQEYRQVILKRNVNDTLHIAAATITGLDAIASWNFKHMVNIKTMERIHTINSSHRYGIIEIVSLEQLGGHEYANR
jgi:predicted nucleic acid-binding protein